MYFIFRQIEAVGHNYLGTFFAASDALLAPGGVMVMQAITTPEHRYEEYIRSTDFINTIVFPGKRSTDAHRADAAPAIWLCWLPNVDAKDRKMERKKSAFYFVYDAGCSDAKKREVMRPQQSSKSVQRLCYRHAVCVPYRSYICIPMLRFGHTPSSSNPGCSRCVNHRVVDAVIFIDFHVFFL